jgi:hypothetical protein
MRSVIGATLVLAVLPGVGFAQNEAALRAAFEGRTVTVRVDMPATSQGIDVYPLEQMPVNFRDVAQRIKDNGTALRMGQQITITKVVIKGTSHVEFQLGGGGYGTFGDYMSSSNSATAVSANETAQEKALRDEIKVTTDAAKKKQMQKELDGLRSARERENRRAEAEASQANEAREANLRVRRIDSGSRFNVRYRHGMPTAATTPEGVMRALAQYLDFTGVPGAPVAVASAQDAGGATSAAAHAVNPGSQGVPASVQVAEAAPAAGIAGLRKGLTIREVETLLGPAATAGEVQEGSMTVMKRTYVVEGRKVAASFVSGVLIDFSITPQ